MMLMILHWQWIDNFHSKSSQHFRVSTMNTVIPRLYMERQYGLLSRHFCTQICSEKLLDGGV